jgi:TPR repeat protein
LSESSLKERQSHMDLRRLATLIACVSAVWPARMLGAQDLEPIADRNRRIEIPGVSVLPPQDADWFLVPEPPQKSASPDSVIRFVKKLDEVPPSRPDLARAVFAGVVVTDSGRATPSAPADFLREFTGVDPNSLIGEMVTGRQRLLDRDAALDESLGALCVRYSRLTEITGQFAAYPALVGVLWTRGMFCSHPQWPQYDVDVTYQQLYAQGEEPLPIEAQAEVFFKSVVFSRTQPKAAFGPKELWTSQFQARGQAYDQARWPEAELAFQRALKAAEYFGPQTPIVAITLYYLGSAQEKQGRLSEVETALRRALEIFDAQTTAEIPELAHFHGLTMNDLAVILGRRAATATAPATAQGLLKEGEHLLQRALALREKTDPSEVGRTLSNLTQVYIDSSRWDDAAVTAERAVSFYEQKSGAAEEVLSQLDRLSGIYLRQERLPQVIRWYRRAAEQGYAPAEAVATRLESHAAALRSAGRDPDAASFETEARVIRSNAERDSRVAVVRQAAEQGDARAQYRLGAMYAFGTDIPQDYAEALTWYRRAAEQSDLKAQFALGEMFASGEGVPQDYTQSMAWYRRAAEQGDMDAQASVGFGYALGQGVPQDDAQAMTWFRKAADQGHANAQGMLGLMYANGEGVPQDHKQAFEWWQKAANQGDASAQFHLGLMYSRGEGVPQDHAQAVAWFRKGADQGEPRAMFMLGGSYFRGRGIELDYVEAHKWFSLAVARASDAAPEDRKRFEEGLGLVVKVMTADQIAEAQKRAKEWLAGFEKPAK